MPVASAVQQQEISQQQSLTLMRNMMRLYLSNVCHGRGLFPESDFERRDVCQLVVTTLCANGMLVDCVHGPFYRSRPLVSARYPPEPYWLRAGEEAPAVNASFVVR